MSKHALQLDRSCGIPTSLTVACPRVCACTCDRIVHTDFATPLTNNFYLNSVSGESLGVRLDSQRCGTLGQPSASASTPHPSIMPHLAHALTAPRVQAFWYHAELPATQDLPQGPVPHRTGLCVARAQSARLSWPPVCEPPQDAAIPGIFGALLGGIMSANVRRAPPLRVLSRWAECVRRQVVLNDGMDYPLPLPLPVPAAEWLARPGFFLRAATALTRALRILVAAKKTVR